MQYSLQQAENRAKQLGTDYFVVARDINPHTGAKAFEVHKYSEFYDYSHSLQHNHFYEVISENLPAKLYFDFEMTPPMSKQHPYHPSHPGRRKKVKTVYTPKSNPEYFDLFTESECTSFIKYLEEQIKDFIYLSFSETHEAVILHSCTESKFSCHFVFPTLVFDNTIFSMKTFVMHFGVYLMDKLREAPQRRMLARAFEENVLDHSVYKRRQMFRIEGSTKLTDNRKLVLFRNEVVFGQRRRCGRENFNKLLVQNVPQYIANRAMCKVVGIPTYIEISPDYRRLYEYIYRGGHFPNMNLEAVRQCQELYKKYYSTAANAQNRKMIQHVLRHNVMATINDTPRQGRPKPLIYDGDRPLFDKENTRFLAQDITDGVQVFCPQCETEKVYPEHGVWEAVSGIGECSAICKVFLRSDEVRRMVHCFNCEVNTIILMSSGIQPMITEEHERYNLNGGFLNADICGLNDTNRVCVIDGPMGVGKTTVISDFLKEMLRGKVLVLTFRRALCNYLANTLKADGIDVICYLDDTFKWSDNRKHMQQENFVFVVCIDSVRKLHTVAQAQGFDYVIIDECLFTLYQLASTLRTPVEINDNIDALVQVLSTCRKKIVLMQHDITQSALEMFLEMATPRPQSDSTVYEDMLRTGESETQQNGLIAQIQAPKPNDLGYNVGGVTKCLVDQPLELMPMKYWVVESDFTEAMWFMANFYATNGSNKPFMVFCTNKETSVKCYMLLMKVAEIKLNRTNARSKILLINKDTADFDRVKAFNKEPDAQARQYDIVICTSVLQAGVSVSVHFVTAFDFLNSGVLSIRETFQFDSRFRVKNRRDLEPFRYSCIQKGKPGSKQACRDELLEVYLRRAGVDHEISTNSSDWHLQIHTKVLADVDAEHNDSKNRFDHLFLKEYRKAQQVHKHMDNSWQENCIVDSEWLAGIMDFNANFLAARLVQDMNPKKDSHLSIDENNSMWEGRAGNIDTAKLFKDLGGRAVVREMLVSYIQRPVGSIQFLELHRVLGTLIHHTWPNLKREADPGSFVKETTGCKDFKKFLTACKLIRQNYQMFLAWTENPETPVFELRDIITDHTLMFVLFVMHKHKVISLDPSKPLFNIHEQVIDNELELTVTVVGERQKERVDKAIIALWRNAGGVKLPMISENEFHRSWRLLNAPTPRPSRNRKDTVLHSATILKQGYKVCKIPFNINAQKEFSTVKNRTLADMAVTVMCLESSEDQFTMLELLQEFLPTYVVEVINTFRRYSLNIKDSNSSLPENLILNTQDVHLTTPIFHEEVFRIVRENPDIYNSDLFVHAYNPEINVTDEMIEDAINSTA